MDPLVILGRVFSNEPLERTMYMIVIWVGLLLLSPDNWPEYVNERIGNDSNLLIVFYVQIMPDDFVMQLHRF
ncbi:hypothetical protein VEGS15_29980 [Escherichia coli]|nr:hypothetical protein VEGS15_29980 [Escherichia coli]